jgi:lactate dehydrogenase-like 2-hydroxyacid dehydrogenase
VSLHVPLIPSTKHMMGAAQFEADEADGVSDQHLRGPVVRRAGAA